jgi:hypothetical protein
MFAAKRLFCVAAIALCWSAAASAQSPGPAAPPSAVPAAPPSAVPAPVAPLPNVVTPPPPRADVLSDPARPNRPIDDRSPLLNPEGAGNPNSPLLPNASPDEPPLRAPLLQLQQ